MNLQVQIVRYIDDEPQPGICECQFTDAAAREWVFIDKVPMFTASYLDANSNYPQKGGIRCQVVRTWQDANGREIVTISTQLPDDLEATTGESSFDVLPTQLED